MSRSRSRSRKLTPLPFPEDFLSLPCLATSKLNLQSFGGTQVEAVSLCHAVMEVARRRGLFSENDLCISPVRKPPPEVKEEIFARKPLFAATLLVDEDRSDPAYGFCEQEAIFSMRLRLLLFDAGSRWYGEGQSEIHDAAWARLFSKPCLENLTYFRRKKQGLPRHFLPYLLMPTLGPLEKVGLENWERVLFEFGLCVIGVGKRLNEDGSHHTVLPLTPTLYVEFARQLLFCEDTNADPGLLSKLLRDRVGIDGEARSTLRQLVMEQFGVLMPKLYFPNEGSKLYRSLVLERNRTIEDELYKDPGGPLTVTSPFVRWKGTHRDFGVGNFRGLLSESSPLLDQICPYMKQHGSILVRLRNAKADNSASSSMNEKFLYCSMCRVNAVWHKDGGGNFNVELSLGNAQFPSFHRNPLSELPKNAQRGFQVEIPVTIDNKCSVLTPVSCHKIFQQWDWLRDFALSMEKREHNLSRVALDVVSSRNTFPPYRLLPEAGPLWSSGNVIDMKNFFRELLVPKKAQEEVLLLAATNVELHEGLWRAWEDKELAEILEKQLNVCSAEELKKPVNLNLALVEVVIVLSHKSTNTLKRWKLLEILEPLRNAKQLEILYLNDE